MSKILRSEYPRPQFVRECWSTLNGEWKFDFDDKNEGLKYKWYKNSNLSQKIIVPFAYQTKLSQIDIQDFHDIVWYERSFDLTEELKSKRQILHFGAVDYKADVWVNGEHMITHEGGHVPFSIEITNVSKEKDNIIVVRAEDPSTALDLPRGKQYWKRKSEGIFYTRTTGIWQSVWIEGVSATYLKKVWMTPDFDNRSISIEYEIDGTVTNAFLNVEISLNGTTYVNDNLKIIKNNGKREFKLDSEISQQWSAYGFGWTPAKPNLFDVVFTVSKDGENLDTVNSYFALRKVSILNGNFMLNNSKFYQKLLLDQGYFEESLLTAPSDESFVNDITLCKEMGFNGVRKHQKIEDPRYLYHADKLGFLVWAEMANAYTYSREYVRKFSKEWIEMIERDYNHPCIVAYVPLNESWGVESILTNKEQQAHADSMYHLTKSLDQTRPVISNDGWEQAKTDILTIHDYTLDGETIKNRYADKDKFTSNCYVHREAFAGDYKYEGQPIIVSEIGGLAYKKSDWEGWGYGKTMESDEEFIEKYNEVISAFLASPNVQGFVYTQITDVEQEINGLMTYDRKPKVDPKIIKAINEGKWKK